ncbi:MAG: serine/threonine-protein kinase [Candidatus Xenobia bacterium]
MDELSGAAQTPVLLVILDASLNIEGAALWPSGRVLVALDLPEALDLAGRASVVLVAVQAERTRLEMLNALRRQTDLPVLVAVPVDAPEQAVAALTRGASACPTVPFYLPLLTAMIEREVVRGRVEQAPAMHLDDLAFDALKDVAAWTRSMSVELARILGTPALGVWVWRGEKMMPLNEAATRPPGGFDLMQAVRAGRHVRADDVVVPIIGMTGEPFGGVVVPRPARGLPDASIRLVTTFARQLAGALELDRLRTEIETRDLEREASRQELLDRGIDVMRTCPWCGTCYSNDVDTCPQDGVQLDRSSLLPYRLRDRYRFVRELGEGAMGMVFLAHDEKLDREVAVKIIRREYFSGTSARLRFEREAPMLAKIEHPGVIVVYDADQLEDGSAFIIMEMLHGDSLAAVLRQHGPGTPQQVAALLRQGGAALSAAHEVSLLHRDIKPENIYLASNPTGHRIKLIDFGLAKNLEVDTGITEQGMLVGTPAYMAPEQVNGRSLDSRTDLYSFAAVAYEALTGRRVTLETDFGLVVAEVVEVDAPPVSSLLSGTPAAIDHAFAWAMQKDPAARPSSVREWVDSFVDQLDSMPPHHRGWPFEMARRRARA